MSRLDDVSKQKKIYEWRKKTGNMIFCGLRKDSKTLAAMEWMKRKPYGGQYDKIYLDGSNA